ncbi:MAG TPA: hypothetical protein VF911_21990 [Thermoanaerobaculia bacterium]|jgi:hypothetical protein
MKTLALLLALLATSCASSNDGFIANDIETCEPGSAIELQAGIADLQVMPDGRFTALVEVGNNSDHDFTVKSVRLDALPRQDQARYDVQGGTRTFDQEIKEGTSHTFEIPMTMRSRDMTPQARGITLAVDVAINVVLADGDSARCRFVLPVRF